MKNHIFLKYVIFTFILIFATSAFGQKKAEPAINFGFLTGASVTKLTFKGDSHDDLTDAHYPPSSNFSAGLFGDWILQPGDQSKWSICNEILYTSFKTDDQYTKESKIESGYKTFDISLEYAYLKVNNMLRYRHFLTGNLSFFLNAGFSNGFAVKNMNHKKNTEVIPSLSKTYVDEGKALDDTKYEIGYNTGIGSRFKNFSLEVRYESSTGMSSYVNLKSPVKRFYFLLGYRF